MGTNVSEILIKNSYIFIQENAFENVVWKMAAILSQPQCVKQKKGHEDDVLWVISALLALCVVEIPVMWIYHTDGGNQGLVIYLLPQQTFSHA